MSDGLRRDTLAARRHPLEACGPEEQIKIRGLKLEGFCEWGARPDFDMG